ncbi:hypothetical protein BKA61DRAFT_578045 [Leptodontidium sp. MPI-SDFR-AT-0119]|nr:hypothetical protein BKA61DRAFT_578045 [Leptodontidium sp. MPI-SDFR-AT-0119]
MSTISTGLHSSVLSFVSGDPPGGSTLINFDHQLYPAVEYLPTNLNTTNSKLSLASSAISLAISLICVVFAGRFWPDGKRTFPIPPIPLLISSLLFNALLSLTAMTYILITHSQSSTFDAYYRSDYREYDRGMFDVEAWTCQINQYPSGLPDGPCWTAKTARWVDVARCAVAVVAAAVGWWALRGEREVVNQARMRKKARDAYWLGDGDGDGSE